MLTETDGMSRVAIGTIVGVIIAVLFASGLFADAPREVLPPVEDLGVVVVTRSTPPSRQPLTGPQVGTATGSSGSAGPSSGSSTPSTSGTTTTTTTTSSAAVVTTTTTTTAERTTTNAPPPPPPPPPPPTATTTTRHRCGLFWC